MDDDSCRRVPHGELAAFVCELFVRAGLPAADAATVAESLVCSDLRGTHSHGVVRAPFLVDRLLQGGARGAGRVVAAWLARQPAPVRQRAAHGLRAAG